MGGSAGKIVNSIGRGTSAALTLGGSEIARNNLGQKNAFNQLLNAPGTIVTGGQSNYANPLNPGLYNGPSNPYVSGPFSLDPNQMNKDQADILGLGNKQYADTLGAIDTNQTAQTQRAKDLFGQMLPNIAENAQAAHLYDSTGYGQEVGRQQANLASQLASDAANQRLQALSGRQGFETGALQRGQSLEDFINSSNVAKTIGAQMAPQPQTGKQNFGTVAQGVGALSPFAKLGRAATGSPLGGV
jgi:hypothetical protein